MHIVPQKNKQPYVSNRFLVLHLPRKEHRLLRFHFHFLKNKNPNKLLVYLCIRAFDGLFDKEKSTRVPPACTATAALLTAA